MPVIDVPNWMKNKHKSAIEERVEVLELKVKQIDECLQRILTKLWG